MSEIAVIDVIVPLAPIVDVTIVGPPGQTGPAGPPGPQGPPGTAGLHQATHAAGGADQIVGPLALGVNPSQSGALRLANEDAITARNGANTGDIGIVKVRPWDQVVVGSAAASSAGFIVGGGNVGIGADTGATSAYTWAVVNTGAFLPSADNAFNLGSPTARVKAVYAATAIRLGDAELTVETVAGTPRLVVRFATGAPVVLAIQP